MRIRVLRRNGFTIDQLRPVALMFDTRSRKRIGADVIERYQGKVDDIGRRIAELAELRDRARRRLLVLLEQREQGGPVEPACRMAALTTPDQERP